jgi:phenylacetate-CoA ligase
MRSLTNAEYLADIAGTVLAYPAYRRRESWTSDRLRAWQLGRIRSLVERAYASVPVYRERYAEAGFRPGDLRTWADFASLPTIGKADLVAGYPERSVAADTPLADCLISTSSGSSGQMMEIPHRADRLWPYVVATERLFRQLAGQYPPSWRHAYIYTSPYPIRGSLGLYRSTFIPTTDDPAPMLAALRRCRPQLLEVYPTVLRDLLAADPETMRRLGLRAVAVSSEHSTREERRSWADILGCPVGDQYSSEELAYIAAECGAGAYHLVEDVTYVEILAPDSDGPADGQGEVVGTELHNRTMPFIRYRQGDLARVETRSCACRPSAAGPIRHLTELAGRANDGFVLADGRRLSPGFLLDACYRAILPAPAEVAAYRLVQTAPDQAELQVVPGAAWMDASPARLRAALVTELPTDLRVDIRVVERLARQEAGKRATVVRDLALSVG